ncbi:2,5-dioxopentanoate dehydrogenase [Halalkalicoccus paucihalophilus]|uniref:2,5-dioxopentanoate dehydrogenase n=1 Tax=Halalkalicoccus paucihalophilus TaxID=1008153 RepID=A0A151AAI3_9EURY|nr:aldehyde dehydrogenase family protein [Halalkalicoccus paucihalophilus]KYH24560.1 2,5-dioxopentanoate dehydrogenase [Halalkalicoccus paucihalophilus]
MTTTEKHDLLIDGEFIPATSGERFVTLNPATEEPITEVAAADKEDIDRAVESAHEAYPKWRSTAPEERGRLLTALAARIREETDYLAELETRDNGKPISQARSDVEGCARYFEYYAGIADKIHGDSIPLTDKYVDYTVREPLGVTGQIIPWNFPVNLVGRTIAPALAAGNVAVAKPAEQTPLSALKIGEFALEVGIPPGVLNVVPGFGATAGASLAGHPDVNAISFTGSVVTGRQVAKLGADNVTPVHLELGGKSPNVVFPDADLDHALDETITAIFATNAGQVCSAGSRLLVHESIHSEFVDRLATRASELTVGPGLEDPDVGPLVSSDQHRKVREYVEIGREEVGDPIVGGKTPDHDGYFVEPTIFDDVDNSDRIAQEEIFGPVLSVIEFSDEREAFELANDVDYGLVAGIFTSDVGRAHRFAHEMEAGQVYINEWFAGGVETPFGGYKQSGFGREKGLEAIESYTQVKNVCARIELE